MTWAGARWEDGNWVFTDLRRRPLNNNNDYYRWKALIDTGGVRDARLHDARHTAATTLLLLGLSERAVIDIMGWPTGKMTLVYQHITDSVRQDAATKVGTFIWGSPSPDETSATPARQSDTPEHPRPAEIEQRHRDAVETTDRNTGSAARTGDN